MYHGPAENDYTHKKNVTDCYPKFHFPFKTVSSGESNMACSAIA